MSNTMTQTVSAISVSGERPDVRQQLLSAVDAIGDILKAGVQEGEETGALDANSIQAMSDAGLFRMKVPTVLGGYEVDVATQFEVWERVSYYSSVAGWCLFIYADAAAAATTILSDAGVERLLAGGKIPLMSAGGGFALGKLTKVDGGYRLTGRWTYGSGLHGAEWAFVFGIVEGTSEVRSCVVAKKDIKVTREWNVLGLKGTGSCDYGADDAFVPDELTCLQATEPLRGGAIYRLGLAGRLGHCVPAVALGIARRAFDEVAATSHTKFRGYAKKVSLAEKATFQAFLGKADLQLKSARGLVIESCRKVQAEAEEHGVASEAAGAEIRAAGCYATKAATEVVNALLSHGGGDAIRAGSLLERSLRDIHVAGTHYFVNESTFENHAQFILGLPTADAMG